jgi:NDP-sugar pyrophosphorylase family protein
MLVKEIIEMSKEKPVATIAKDHLTMGEKKLRDVLKAIGGHHQTGQKGWTFQGKPEDLEKSIYDFVEKKKRTNPQKPKAIKVQANENTLEQNKIVTGELVNKGENEIMGESTTIQAKQETKEQTNEVTRKRASFDIDVEMLKKIKHYAIEKDLKVYEVVEQALLLFAKEKGL